MEQHLTERVGKLEIRADKADEKIKNLDDNHARIWQRLDEHRDVQLVTKTRVEGVGEDVSEIKANFKELVNAQQRFISLVNDKMEKDSGKWTSFWKYAFIVCLTILLSLIFDHSIHIPLGGAG